MITRMLVLAIMLALTLVSTTPSLAGVDIATAEPIPGYPDFEMTDKGTLVYGGDVIVGKCGIPPEDFAFQSASLRERAASACEKAGYSAPLSKTGGLPIILAPIALLVACGFLICKSTARLLQSTPRST